MYFSNIFFFGYILPGQFWIRLNIKGKPGIGIKNTRKHGLTFSQRNGYQKILKLGRYCIYKLPEGI